MVVSLGKEIADRAACPSGRLFFMSRCFRGWLQLRDDAPEGSFSYVFDSLRALKRSPTYTK